MMRSLADCLEVGLEEPVDDEDALSDRLRATEPKNIVFKQSQHYLASDCIYLSVEVVVLEAGCCWLMSFA